MKRSWFNNTLLRIQKFTRIDIRYLLSGGFFLSMTQVSSALMGVLLTVAFANLISPETYGTYKYVLATYTLLSIATLPGVDTAVMRAIAKGHSRALVTGIKLKMKWSILGGITSLLYAMYNFSNDEHTLGILFTLVAIALPFIEIGTLYASYFNAKKQYKFWSASDIATQIISSISLLTVLYFSGNIVLLIIAYLAPLVIIKMSLTYFVYRQIPSEATDEEGMQKYAYSLTFFQILTRIISSIDQIVLFHFLGPASVAVFSIANAIPNRIKGLFRVTGTLAFPKLIKRSGSDIYATMPRKMFLMGSIILVMCICYYFFVPILFTYVFPKYAASIAYSQALVFFSLSAITYPFNSFLLAHKKIRENYALVISSFIVKISCLFVFVPLYGIWGAVIGILAAASVIVLYSMYFLYKGRNEDLVASAGT